MRVLDIIAEPIRFHRLADSEAQARRIVADLLDVVGLGERAPSAIRTNSPAASASASASRAPWPRVRAS